MALRLSEGDVQHEQVRVGVAEAEAEQGELRCGAAVEAAGDRRPGVEHVLADEDEPDGGDTQVDPTQPGSDGAEDQPGQARDQDGHDHPEHRGELQPLVVGGAPARLPGHEHVRSALGSEHVVRDLRRLVTGRVPAQAGRSDGSTAVGAAHGAR